MSTTNQAMIAFRKAKATGRYWVYLSSEGNPDYGQYAPVSDPSIVFADTLVGLREACSNYIAKWNLGGGNFGGAIVGEGRMIFGHFSYNGRLWEGLPYGSKNQRELEVA